MDPRPSFEWVITSKCNYACSYCCKHTNSTMTAEHCSNEVIESVYRIIDNLSGQWFIKLMGGEPMIHPQIFSIVDKIARKGHQLSLTTNFSLPVDHYKELSEKLGENLKYLGASLHLEQVKNVDDFIKKAVEFQRLKNFKTRFSVVTVLFEDKFPILKEVADRLDKENIHFSLQHYRVDGRKHYEYRDHKIKEFLESRHVKNLDKIRNVNLFGTLCYAGSLFFSIGLRGEITRCYNRQILFRFGNVKKKNFKPIPKPMPCLSRRCTCTIPANRGMILFGQKANIIEVAYAIYEGLKRRILL